jgi:NAD(P)H-flavin reductase
MFVKKYRSKVVSVSNPVQGIYCVEFESLNGRFRYEPGQFLHLALDSEYDGTGQWPESRCFSMQSNPDESTIRITYAVKGRFTKLMKEYLKPDSEVWLKMPYGDLFSRPHNKIDTVFIAGGTGITPFLSLFTHVSFREYINPRIYLGFKSESYNIYKDELNLLNKDSIKIYYDDLHGFMNIDLINKENSISSYYYISGPPAMISNFKNELILNGVLMSQILTDDWF